MTNAPELVEHLSKELSNGTYECAVCSELIERKDRLWTCRACFGVFHLPCISFWADTQRREREKQLRSTSNVESAAVQDKVRCPRCQALSPLASTRSYWCYCGKTINPPVDAMLVPGSCGEPCERSHADLNCPHKCVLMCHPGPCPPCSRTRTQACYCGHHTKVVGCSSEVYGYECGETCDKLLDCGQHRCTAPCHPGPCPLCTRTIQCSCYCGATTREVRCGEDTEGYRCENRCQKLRDCGHHTCGTLCHPGPCEVCLRLPARQRYCPCGKALTTAQRTSCLDPIPSCGAACELPLPCGHLCWYPCHDETPCAPCREMTEDTCACGATRFSFPCFCQYLPQAEWAAAAEAISFPVARLPAAYPPRCNKVCRAQLSCHKHKCNQVCCTNRDHLCFQICTKKLSCGHHTCGQLCHVGSCPPCSHVSYERLYCRCRRTWVEPPVPCGTPPPRCNHPCVVPRPCGHPSNHPCHIEPSCPDCVAPVQKFCASHHHPMPYHMPCNLINVSCGKRCGKPLTCCGTACERVCHGGPCEHKCSKLFPSFADAIKKK